MILRLSTLFLRTLREDPADAEVPSHRLLVRAGYVRRAAPGIYSYLPLGWRVLRNIERVVRAARRVDPQPAYNLPGTSSTLAEFFGLVAKAAGIKPPGLTLSPSIGRVVAQALRPLHVLPDPVVFEMAAHHWGLSSRYAAADLGYRSRPAAQTIGDTVAWLRASGLA